jgi:hypothetical protein
MCFQTKMVGLFDSMDWGNEEDDLGTVVGSGTQITSEIARDTSDNPPKLPVQTISGKKVPES